MGSDSDDSDLILVWAVTPEYPIGPLRSVLSVGFKNLLIIIIRVLEGVVLMVIEAGMPWVTLKKLNAFINLLKESLNW